MSTRQKWWTAATVLMALAAALWWFWGDGDLDRLQDLQAQMRDDSLSDDQRRALRQQFRDQLRALPEADREQFFASAFRGRMNRNLGEFFALLPKQRTAYLDREINKSEQRRKQMQGRRGAQGPPGGFGGGNRSPADREVARKQRLDSSSAEDRAQQAEYRRLMNERRTARGLEPTGRRG